jgi:hypothetical protein
MLDSRDREDPGWFQDRGETVFSAFPQGSDFLGDPGKTWAISRPRPRPPLAPPHAR